MCHQRALEEVRETSAAHGHRLSSPLRPEAAEKEMKRIVQSKCVGELGRVLWPGVRRRAWEGARRVREPGCEQAGGIMGKNVKCQEISSQCVGVACRCVNWTLQCAARARAHDSRQQTLLGLPRGSGCHFQWFLLYL